MTFPAKLHAALAGLSYPEAAPIIGASRSAVEKWGNGSRTPSKLTQDVVLRRLRAHHKKQAKQKD